MQTNAELRSCARMARGQLARLVVVTLAALSPACGDKPVDAPMGPPGVVMTTLARSAAPSPSMRSVTPVPSDAMDQARAEILAHVPSASPEPRDGGTRLGTETEDPIASSDPVAPPSPPRAETHVSLVSRPRRSAPAIERLLRATVYFTLVSRCKDEKGAILPPEAVTIGFELDASGAIIDGTITAAPKAPEHEAAAECMIRELAASGFRAPPATRGESTTVSMAVPSVD